MASYEYYFIFLKLFVFSVADMKILFVSATDFELGPVRSVFSAQMCETLCTGWGATATVEALEPLLESGGFDRVVDVGIAGSFSKGLPKGSVVHVVRERHADRGGEFLVNPSPWPELGFLTAAAGNTIQDLDDRWRGDPADVETMEGAAFFECCLRHGVPFAEIRAVSNYVGERDHALWDIPLALENLRSVLSRFLNLLAEPS